MHHHRSGHWVVVSGLAKILNGDREFLLETNQSTYIEKGHRHRLRNPTGNPLMIVEVQSVNIWEKTTFLDMTISIEEICEYPLFYNYLRFIPLYGI